jgi:hypothetical protein
MTKFCTACGVALVEGRGYCGGCGAAVIVPPSEQAGVVPPVASTPPVFATPVVDTPYAVQTPSPIGASTPDSQSAYTPPPPPPPPEPVYAAPESTYYTDEPVAPKNNNKLLIGGGLALVALLGGLYFFLFRSHNMSNEGGTPTAEATPKAAVAATKLYAVTQANIRDKATATGSNIIGKIPRGTEVSGKLALGEDGVSDWLELADGKGFVGAINLSEIQPPVLSKVIADKIWVTDKAMEIWAQPDSTSSLIDRASAGTSLTLAGLTANDYIEIKLRKGGVGYIADGARILALLDAKPIAMNFNANTCSFGGEVQPLFEKLGAAAKAEYDAIDNNTSLSDAAREKALGAIEGKSHYQKLQRSFKGLTLTGIAQHYESQSVYFAEPPAKVIEVFRSLGFKIGKDGAFASQDLYAGINATSGKAATFGKSDLGCGV